MFIGRFIISVLTIYCTTSLKAQVDFENHQNIVTGSYAEVVEIGDFNKDGLNDVILGTKFYFDPANDYKLKIYLQDSTTGDLLPPIVHSYSDKREGIGSICLGDLNLDGNQDVIIGAGDVVKVFYQNSQGGLGAYQDFPSGVRVSGVGVGNLNNDSLPDFVASHSNEDYIRVFYQTSNGFNPVDYPKVASSSDELKVFDMNQDGKDDVVFMNGRYPSGGMYIYLQDSSGTLNDSIPYSYSSVSSRSPSGFDVSDIDHDGRVDMVASIGGNQPSSKIIIWNNHDSSGLVKGQPLSLPAYDIPQPVKIHDLNCDAKNEIITVHGGWNSVSVYESDSSYSFSNYSKFTLPYASHYSPYGVAVGDINNDNKPDIVSANYNSDLVLLYNKTPNNPSHYSKLDTINWQDTSFAGFQDSIFKYSETKNWVQDSFRYFQTDSFHIKYRFRIDSIIAFETLIKSGIFCDRSFNDTITTDSVYINRELVSLDTVLQRRIIDTTKNNTEPKDSIDNPNDSLNTSFEIVIYPNPNRGEFFIKFPSLWSKRGLILKIYDSSGRIVYENPITVLENKSIVSTFYLTVGVYQVLLSHKGNPISMEKIVVIK